MDTKQQLAYLRAAGHTQKAIASELGVSQPLISLIESGKSSPDLKLSIAMKLAAMVRKQKRRDRKVRQ